MFHYMQGQLEINLLLLRLTQRLGVLSSWKIFPLNTSKKDLAFGGPEMPPATPTLGCQAPHVERRPGKHLLGLSFFPSWGHEMEVQIWSRLGGVPFSCLPEMSIWNLMKTLCQRGRNPACIQALDTATFAIKVDAKLHTCLDSQWTPIINAAQNLATGRWTIIIMPKKIPLSLKKEKKRDSSHFLPASPSGSPSAATYARSSAPYLISIDPVHSQ